MNLSFSTPDAAAHAPRCLPPAASSVAHRSPFVARAMATTIIALFSSTMLLAPMAASAQEAAPASPPPAPPAAPQAPSPSPATPASSPGAPAPSTPSAPTTPAGSDVEQSTPDDNAAMLDPLDSGLMPTTDTQQNLPNRELDSQIVFQVLAAEIALQRGQAAPAYQTYLSLARSTQDPRMAQRAAEIALAAQSTSDALTAARLWQQYAPASPQAAQLDATLLVLNGDLDEARPLLKRQLDSVPDAERGDAILALQALIARGPDHIGGVRTLQQLLSNDMNRPEASTAIGRQQMVASDAPGAAVSFENALKIKPDYAPAALLLAQLGADQRREALQIVSGYTKQHPKEHDARFLLAQLYLADNQVDAARSEFETLHRDDPTDASSVFALGLLSLQTKGTSTAEKYFTEYADLASKPSGDKKHVDGGPAYIYLAQIAAQRKDLPAADAWLAKVDASSNEYVTAQIARAELLTLQKRYDDALTLLQGVRPRTGREAVALGRATAGVLMQSGRYAEAEQRLAALLELVPNDPDTIYDYAMAAERNAHYKRMEEELRRLLVLDPNNAQAYNALGYSLADRGQRLDEADSLIKKALALAPDDAYIIDSAGWVQFKLGNKDAAVTLLRRAYQLQPNAEIGAHLADVLWSQGKHDEARTVLRAAQQLDPTDDTLIATMHRLKVTQQ